MPYRVWLLDEDDDYEVVDPGADALTVQAATDPGAEPWFYATDHEDAAERCASHFYAESDYAGEFRVAVSDGVATRVFAVTAEEMIAYSAVEVPHD